MEIPLHQNHDERHNMYSPHTTDYMEDDCNPNGTDIYLQPPNSLYGHVNMVREGGYVLFRSYRFELFPCISSLILCMEDVRCFQ